MQIFRLAATYIKIQQIPHVIFRTKRQLFFKLCITLRCFIILLCFFKRSPSKCNFSVFQLLAWKLTKFLTSPYHPSPITHHPSVSWHIIPTKFYSWRITWFGQKESIKVQFFRLLSALMKVHPIPRAIFETTRSGFIKIFYHCLVSLKMSSLYFCR